MTVELLDGKHRRGSQLHVTSGSNSTTHSKTQLMVQQADHTSPLLSPQHMVALFDALNTGVIVADMNGSILTMNPLALKLFGLEGSGQARRHIHTLARKCSF